MLEAKIHNRKYMFKMQVLYLIDQGHKIELLQMKSLTQCTAADKSCF